MLRLTALALFVTALCVYAWRNWFVSLCGLVLLTMLLQHPNMPHAVLGVPGLNPWNLVFGVILLAWLVHRGGGAPTLPPWFVVLLAAYVLVPVVVAGARALLDTEEMTARGIALDRFGLLFDLILNPLKYLLVGVLFFLGCRTRGRLRLGVYTVLLLGLLYSLMMYKTMKGMVFTGNFEDARRMTDKMLGLHANDLAGLLTFAFWSMVVYAATFPGTRRAAAIAAAIVILPTIIGCHSRAAFLANIAIALALGAVRWRKLLLIAPLAVAVLLLIFPQVYTRLSMGLSDEEDPFASAAVDWNDVTAGRTYNIWDPVLAQIGHAPLIGHGRMAIRRTQCYEEILAREGNVPAHPHNSYLEIGLDSGIIGLGIAVGLLLSAGWVALGLFRTRGDPLIIVTGGIGFVAVVNTLTLSLSSNFLYPKQSMLWLICSGALTAGAWTLGPLAYGHQRRAAATMWQRDTLEPALALRRPSRHSTP